MTRQAASQTHQQAPAPALTASGVLQRKCDCGQHTIAGGECSACSEERGGSLQRSALNRDSTNGNHSAVPSIVHDVLNSTGQPLDVATRAFFEPRFGHDFSHVRVHTDNRAAESAREVNASAYTVGHDVVFGSGHYRPATTAGQGLLAHELAHVLQQNHSLPRKEHLIIGGEHDSPERDADAAAVAVLNHKPPLVSARHSHSLVQRQLPTSTTYHVTPTCIPGQSRSVTVQPVYFKNSATDTALTGHTLSSRLGQANRVWGKLGVHFATATPVVIVNATLKAAGTDDASTTSVLAAHSGGNIEAFFVDNQMTWTGGARTYNCPGVDAKIVLSDHGSNNNLLAHELGHVLGLGHPPGMGAACGSVADANTIMTPSNSNDGTNPSRNTLANYRLISWPAPGTATCLSPDVTGTVEESERNTLEKPERSLTPAVTTAIVPPVIRQK